MKGSRTIPDFLLKFYSNHWVHKFALAAFVITILTATSANNRKRHDDVWLSKRVAYWKDQTESIATLLDFLEVGTSDFGTIVQTAEASPEKDDVHGVSVDAMKIYLDRLPALPHCRKINAAVVGYEPHLSHIDVYYVDPSDIVQHGLPEWLKGCNRVGRPHETTAKVLKEKGLESLMQQHLVPVLSIAEILEQTNGCRIKTLKLDIEGLDPELVVAYVMFLWNYPHCYADELWFEFNELSTPAAQQHALNALSLVGYRAKSTSGFDATWAYDPNVDARRWMKHVIHSRENSRERGQQASLDKTTMMAILENGSATFS